MGESAEIASLRAEIEALKMQVMSLRSDMDMFGGAVSSSGTGGPASGGYGTPWAIPDGYRLPGGGAGGLRIDYPYEVRKFSKDGEDTYAIRIHQNVLMVAGTYVDVTGEGGTPLTPFYESGESDDEDWYVCPVSDGRVYLNVEAYYEQSVVTRVENRDYTSPNVFRTRNIVVSCAEISGSRKVKSGIESGSDRGKVVDGAGGVDSLGTNSWWSIELCNIADGVPYQKVFGTLNLTGPTGEIVTDPFGHTLEESGDFYGGEIQGIKTYRFIDALKLQRTSDGQQYASVPLSFVADSSNVHFSYEPLRGSEGFVNAIHLSVDGGEDSEASTESDDEPVTGEGISPFAVKGGKITNRCFLIGRQFRELGGEDPSAADGRWYLKIPHADYGDAELVKDPPEGDTIPSDAMTLIPLYVISNGAISRDYRGMPVAVLRE